MKTERIWKRLLSLLLVISIMAAWAIPANAEEKTELTFEQVDNSAVTADRPGQDKVAERSDTAQYDADDVVRVSIVLEKASTIGAGYDPEDIAWNRGAISYRESLQKQQAQIASAIGKMIGGELDVVWNLTLAANIISANVEYGKIEQIKGIDGIQDVVLETRYEPAVISKGTVDPNMATSDKQIGSSTAWASGYTGAGSRIAIIDTGIDKDHLSFDAGAYAYSLEQLAQKAGVSTEEYVAGLDLLDAEEIAAVADQLNVEISADQAYVSAKIPYGYNYVDGDYDITHLNDTQEEHGSHVTGIAAANAYVPEGDGYVSALEAVSVQGVAPDAQVLTMKVFGKGGGAYDSDYMAAIEDAIVLGADSINLSLGSANPGMSSSDMAEYQSIMDNLAKSGVVVTMSAGNSGSWVENAYNVGYLYSDDVSMDTVGSPGSFTNSLAVASVDNDGFTGAYLTVGDTTIFYTETSGYGNEPMTTIAGAQEYVLVDGFGTEEDWAAVGNALKGKIAICSRGTTSFFEKANAAVDAGAIATIIYNNDTGTISMNLQGYEHTEPCVSILQSDGDFLRDAAVPVTGSEGNVLYYTGSLTVGSNVATTQYDSDFYTMSSFSSWGVPGSLELKPEITAPGGNIYSVAGAYAGGISDHVSYENMSGTSMAAPQVAGMAALVAQYIRETGLDAKTGLNARTLAQSLLMSTAEPIFDGETEYYYPVLQQGAGLANVGSAVTADSYIQMGQDATDSYADGKVKVELGDDPDRSGVYSFSFTIHNLTDEDRAYTLSADFFTQDVFTYYANENQSMDETALFMDTWTTPLAAGVSWTVNGKSIQANAALNGMDFNGDGTVDSADGQALLDYATGVRTELSNEGKADLNGDGAVNSYDAYLFLSRLTSGTVQVSANGSATVSVTVVLTADQKEELDAYYPNGAYIEGYAYVNGVTSDEGVKGTIHSIPVLGFYGSWSDPSMFDVGSKLEYDYGQEIRDPYLGDTDANAFSVTYADDTDNEYYFGGNPVVEDAEYLPERDAINSDSQIAHIFFTSIRNAGASLAYVSDVTTGEKLLAEEVGPVSSAFYYTNGGSWQYVNHSLGLGLAPAELDGASEGDTLEIGLALAPEYYVDSEGNVDWDSLGKGAAFSICAVVDNTAPELKEVAINADENTLDVTVIDNQYVAAVALFDEFGEYLYTYQGSQADAEAGETGTYHLDLTDVDGAKFLLQVYDYALNTATYEIAQQIGDVTDTVEGIEISDEALVLVKGRTAKLTASVLPVNATERHLTWSTSDETVATVDENGLVTGVAEGSCVITAASVKDPTITASCNVSVVVIEAALQGVLQDEEGYPMFFSWSLKDSDTWTGGVGLDTNIAAAAVDVHTGQLYVQDANSWAMHKIDAATGESLEISDGCGFGFAMSDLASAGYYSSADAPLLAGVAEACFLSPIDPMENTFNSGWDLSQYLSKYSGGSKFVTLAYYGAYQDEDDGTIYDEFLALDDTGYIWILDYAGGSSLSLGFLPTNLNATFADYDGYQFSSMVSDDSGDLYLSAFDGNTNVIYYLTFNPDTSAFDALCIGDFGDGVWPAVLTEAVSDGEEAASAAEFAGVTMVAEQLAVETLPAKSETAPAPAGGLNSVAVVSGGQTRPLSTGSASEDGTTVTVTVTAKDAQGTDVASTNGVAAVTYDPEKLELTDVTVNGDYTSVNNGIGEVTIGYVALSGIDAGDTVATLVFAVRDDTVDAITIDHEEVNDTAPGYKEVLTLEIAQEPTDPEPTDPQPTDPKPTDPQPTDPKPTDPQPTDPRPTDPKPTESEPTDPQPTESEPTDPEPIEPKPTTPSNPSAPGTGDYVLPIFLTALLISALGIAAVVVYRRKFN